jgi:hypothetical protein
MEKKIEQKEYETRLRFRLKLLKEKYEEGKILFPPDFNFKESLFKVKLDENGEVDLDTVDGIVRSLALAVEATEQNNYLRETISLFEIQKLYFTFIENNFGKFYKMMVECKATPHQFALFICKNEEYKKYLVSIIPEFLLAIFEFWENYYQTAYLHVEEIQKSKGIYGGSLFPYSEENIASKCGIYIDTIILPDPFIRSEVFISKENYDKNAYYFIKHGLNILQYKDLALSTIDPPIIAILPDYEYFEDNEVDFIKEISTYDILFHSQKIFNRSFESIKELMDFAFKLDTIEKVNNLIVDSERVIFNIEDNRNFISRLESELQTSENNALSLVNPGIIVANSCTGRMTQSNALLIKSARLNGVPIIDAPTSWQYFCLKLEYDALRSVQGTELNDIYSVKSLHDLTGKEFQWIGKIPIEALIEIRKTGAIEEIRGIIGKGLNDIQLSQANNYTEINKKVKANLEEAFNIHLKNMKKLQAKKLKFYGVELASCIAVGTMKIASAATGNLIYALLIQAAEELLPIPKFRELPKSIKELSLKKDKINKSPIGLLFKYKD